MNTKESMSARVMREADLDTVLKWRNNPFVRSCMLSQHEISRSEHRAWFNRVSKDNQYAPLIIEENEKPRGCVIFSAIQQSASAYWSFYSSPENKPGSGRQICTVALDFAFSELAINKVIGEVLDFNQASICIHERLGFTREGILREHCLINGKYHNLLCFGILAKEWLTLKIK